VLAFSDAEIIRLGREEYISVAADDWYQRRRQDAEGKFFVAVANQGPQKGQGGATRQGIYCLTAGGKLLAFKNAGQNPDVMREVLQQGLAKWRKLPESERAPGAFKVPEHGKADQDYVRTPPAGGLILSVYARALDQPAPARFSDAVCKLGSGDEASRDHLWLTATEWKSLLPANAKKGGRFPMPPRVAERILRFHLIDNTRGEPPMWRRDQIRSSDLTFTVEQATPAGLLLRLEGSVLLATDADPAKAARGYDARLLGYLRYDTNNQAIDRFDIVAVGDHWGEGTYTRGARPGRKPFGVAFELARGDSPADRIAPQAAREIGEYFRP
jgi:hypothetical protein